MVKILFIYLFCSLSIPSQAMELLEHKIHPTIEKLTHIVRRLKDCIIAIEIPSKNLRVIIAADGIDEQSQFPIASLSKQFTAVAVLKALAIKNGDDFKKIKDDLHKPLSILLKDSLFLEQLSDDKIYPHFKNKKPKDWLSSTTIHQLLTHTSGLENFNLFKNLLENFSDEAFVYPIPQDHVKLIKSVRLTNKTYNYSNTNYLMLAKILEIITKKSFLTYLNDEIVIPLNLQNTSHPEKGSFNEIKALDKYSKLILNSSDLFTQNTHNLFGSYGMISCARDLLIWSKALHSKNIVNKNTYKLLTDEHIKLVDNKSYGYGIFVSRKKNDGKILHHNGSLGRIYNSQSSYHQGHDLHAVILSANPDSFALLSASLEYFLNYSLTQPDN